MVVWRQYAVSYGFCFNFGCPKPNHSGYTCPEGPPPHPRACTKCTGHHLSLLHKGNDSGCRFRLRDQKRKVANSDANQEMPPAATLAPQQQGTRQGLVPPAGNKHQASVSANGVSTRTAQVLLNVRPVTVTSENGDFLFTYVFFDNGCTDTLVDYELSDQLNLEGTFEQIIKTVRNSEELVERQCVSFTLSPVEGCGHHIEDNVAYVLPDLSQLEQGLSKTLDIKDYPHLRDLNFP